MVYEIEKGREEDEAARSEPLFRCFNFILKDTEPMKTKAMVIYTL